MQKFRAYPLILWLFLLPLLAQPALGADATSFDPTRVEVKAKGSGGVPVGTIISWPVSQNPEDMDNWLECNGQSISRSVYPELYALLGSRTPDLRGLFLRGHGGNSAALGVQQGDAIRNITGRISFADAYIDGASGVMNSQGSSGSYATGGLTPNGSPDDFSFDASRVVPTANENRPVNQAVRYLVRARP